AVSSAVMLDHNHAQQPFLPIFFLSALLESSAQVYEPTTRRTEVVLPSELHAPFTPNKQHSRWRFQNQAQVFGGVCQDRTEAGEPPGSNGCPAPGRLVERSR